MIVLKFIEGLGLSLVVWSSIVLFHRLPIDQTPWLLAPCSIVCFLACAGYRNLWARKDPQ